MRNALKYGSLGLGGSKYAEKLYFWLSIIIVGSWYLYLNLSIPLYADDYSHSMADNSRRLESLMDIITSTRIYYQNWGGRIVSVAIGKLALLGEWQRVVFRILNTCVFLGLNLLLVDFGRSKLSSRVAPGSDLFNTITGSGRVGNETSRPIWMLFLISFYLFWLFVRTLGETTIWLSGSIHYLWIPFFLLLFLKLSTLLYKRINFPILISHVLVGFFAGCGYESTSFTGLMMFLVLVFRWKGEYRRTAWQIPGFLAYLAGYILLITAPGNGARAEAIGTDRTFFSMLVNNIPQYLELHLYSWEVLLLLLILALVALKKMGRIGWTTWLFAGAGFLNNVLILASPTVPLRSGSASSAFFICAIISILSDPRIVAKRVLNWILIAFTAVSIIPAVSDGISYWEARLLDKERKAIASEALANGESTVEWPLPRTRFNKRVFDRDIRASSNYWINEAVAQYHGFAAVYGKQPGWEYYNESTSLLTANSDFGDVRLIDISKHRDAERCFLYFHFSANRRTDVNWEELFFRLRYKYDGALYQKIFGLLPGRLSERAWAKTNFMTRPYQIGENDYVFIHSIPKEHFAINRIELSIESRSEIYRWSRKGK